MNRFLFSLCVLCLSLFIITACASSSEEEEIETTKIESPNEDAEVLYREGLALIKADETVKARAQFDRVEQQYPYSRWAAKSQLMTAYTHYRQLNYEAALVRLERFIDLNPAHPDLPYAYYLTAMSYYEQIADVGRDQGTTESARQALKDVIQRYPGSDYAREAKLKLDLTEDHLAGKEMEIGRFYLRKNNLTGAVNRFKGVVDNFETTMHTPEALYRLVEIYTILGLNAEARETASVLGHNFPGDRWYARAYELLTGRDVAGVDGAADIEPNEDASPWWDVF